MGPGWIIMVALTAATGAALFFFVRRDRGAIQFLLAALLLALAGYAWQGAPELTGAPKAPPERQQLPDSVFAQTREDMLGRFDRASYWLTMSEGYARRGDTQGAAQVIESGLRDSPNDPDLWVGLGNALVVHSGGMMTPAAQLAFQRATEIAPEHPGPRFFYGIALAQGGQFDQAERIWRQLLAEAPPGAEYRRTIEEQLQALGQARAMSGIPAPAQPQVPAQEQAPATNGQ